MYTKQEIIIRHYREGKSQRQIAKELQISRKTVKRYLDGYEAHQTGSTKGPGGLHDYLSQAPKYTCPRRSKRALTQEVASQIDELLKENELKRSQGLHKQLMKKIDIHHVLQQQGYPIGYTTVCEYINSQTRRKPESYIRQRYERGSVCEFDWGEVKLHLAGQRTVLQMAVFTSAYSNYRYACLFHRQDTLAFMESHVQFFAHTQGVYHQLVYDNMRVAVARFVGKHEKEPTQALINLKGHYQFHHRFCNAYRGHEKGHVERSVEYIRRKAFAYRSEFTSLDQASTYLEQVVTRLNGTTGSRHKKTPKALFSEEQAALWKVPAPFSCYDTEQLRADKYATVSFGGNRYSVPDHLVGAFVEVKIYSHQLKIYYQDQLIANHQRSYGHHSWTISLDHYLDTLAKKPGALPHSEALAQCSAHLRQLYVRYYADHPREFIALIQYCQQHQISPARLHEAEQALLKVCPTAINTEKLIALLGNTPCNHRADAVVPDNEQDTRIQQASLAHLATLTHLIGNPSNCS